VIAFLLWHMRPIEGQANLGPGVDDIETDDKLCGVFSTRERAEAAARHLTDVEGFSSHPDGFLIDEYEVDQVHWETGFVTLGPGD
jgi:hypothetical protein